MHLGCLHQNRRASDTFADLVLETITEAVLVVAADGRIAGVNKRATMMFGYAEGELVGQTVERLMPERYRSRHAGLREGFASESSPRMMGGNRELYALRSDGGEFPVEVGLGPMRADGEHYVIVSIVDITARKKAELEVARLNEEVAAMLLQKNAVLEDTQDTLQKRTRELGDALSLLANAERRKVEEERKRLSLELHDEVGQMLAALSINLGMIQRRCNGCEAEEPLRNARSIVEDVVKSIRDIVIQLRPPQLDDLGLTAALRWHLDRVRQTSFLKLSLDENLGKIRLPRELEMSCFRLIQESITNTLRHASAREIAVKLCYEPDRLKLSISDDGTGFDATRLVISNANPGHFGLAGMRERVRQMYGRFNVFSEPGLGCTISAEIPLFPASPGAAP